MAIAGDSGFAAPVDVPVYAAVGRDALERVEDLSIRAGIRQVSTPRRAALLLVAGRIRAGDREALHRVHDQLPHPRATLCWSPRARDDFEAPIHVPPDDDPLPALRQAYRQLLAGRRASESHLLKDEPPAPWRGRGDHGQGGEGMMGGAPYGRPMAMPGEDLRDGLMLDACRIRLGPFLPVLPPGLVLEVTLQGDVIQHAEALRPPLPPGAAAAEAFRRADQEAPQVAALERARAAHHLRCVARLLWILQLGPQAERFRRAAGAVARGERIRLRLLHGLLRLGGVQPAIPAGLGYLDPAVAAALGGVAARASGAAVDARHQRPGYRELGFQPQTQGGGDVRARLRQWLAEIRQSLQLAAAAGDARAGPGRDIETPWGPQARGGRQRPASARFTDLLRGLEWQEAMLVIASFDAATLRRIMPAPSDEPEAGRNGEDDP